MQHCSYLGCPLVGEKYFSFVSHFQAMLHHNISPCILVLYFTQHSFHSVDKRNGEEKSQFFVLFFSRLNQKGQVYFHFLQLQELNLFLFLIIFLIKFEYSQSLLQICNQPNYVANVFCPKYLNML